MRIVFDLDSTLSDPSHRLHLIDRTREGGPDWDQFFSLCHLDKPHRHVLHVLADLRHSGHWIEIWTGRSEAVRDATIDWLRRHELEWVGFRPDYLRMRPAGDHTPGPELKRAWLNEARLWGRAPELVFEDDPKVVAMWRAEGIPCFQVADGGGG